MKAEIGSDAERIQYIMEQASTMYGSNHPYPLSYDGFGINGPGTYRDRICTFNVKDQEDRDSQGRLFEAAPAMLVVIQEIIEVIGPPDESGSSNTALDDLYGMAMAVFNMVCDGVPQ